MLFTPVGDVYRPEHDKYRAPFGGAELNWMGTRLDTFRSSERRRRVLAHDL